MASDSDCDSLSPKVSVLVTAFNRERYLAESVRSVMNSSFQDFEIIIVDDCSSDRSLEIAKQLAEEDGRIHVHANRNNLGDYRNRNKAASLAQGRYLKYLDADDVLYRHSLAVMVEAMERFPAAALALSANLINPGVPYPVCYVPDKVYHKHFLGRSPLGVGPSASIVRRDCFEAVGGFSGKQFVGDSELWLTLTERWPLVSLPPALVWWRQHAQQQIRLEASMPQAVTVRYRLELDMLDRTQHLSEAEKVQARKRLKHLHARALWSRALKAGHPHTAWQLFRASGLSIFELATGLKRPEPWHD